MFYVKNDDIDDMDDMMRKAADDYELNHELASDWNKVYAGIEQPEQSFIVKPQEKKRRKYLLFLWFILIPALLITAYKLNLFTISSYDNKAAVETKHADDSQQKKLDNEVIQKKNNTAVDNKSSISNQKKASGENNGVTDAQTSLSSQIFLSSNIKNNKAGINNHTDVVGSTINNNSTVKNSSVINDDDKQMLPASNQNYSLQENSLTNASTGLINKNQTGINKAAAVDTVTIKQQSLSNNVIPTTKNISKDLSVAKSSKQKNKINDYTRKAFAYAGIMANADISFIKNQKTSLPSLGGGIVGGYHFKNGLSIESGLLYDRKNYYTKGQYFNTDKLSYLQNVRLLATNGNCYMYEIPLNITYDFKSHKKYNWFVTAGASSYLMHKEYYNFKYEKNGMYDERDYNYYHTSKNWFAVLNIGGGVSIQASNKYFIKVQPYYKAPLSGIGIGRLPLSSAGMNFSLTRRIP